MSVLAARPHGRSARRRVALDDLAPAEGLADAVQALLAPLVEARLLVVSTTENQEPRTEEPKNREAGDDGQRTTDNGQAVVEVAHEALIRSWPTLRGWVDADRADLRFQIQFEEDAQEWAHSGKSADFLWSGLRLANAEAWVARSHPRLNARDQAFLDASRTQEQARGAEKAATARRLRWLARGLAAVAAVAVVLAVAAGVFSVQSQQSAADARAQGATAVAEKQRADDQGAIAVAASDRAQQQAALALARQLVAQADADTYIQPDRALLFSIEANPTDL